MGDLGGAQDAESGIAQHAAPFKITVERPQGGELAGEGAAADAVIAAACQKGAKVGGRKVF